MGQVAFDTLEYTQTLRDAGMPQKEAEAFARANASAFRQMLGQGELATKQDIATLRQEMAEMKTDITKTIFNMLLGYTAAIGAIAAVVIAIMAYMRP